MIVVSEVTIFQVANLERNTRKRESCRICLERRGAHSAKETRCVGMRSNVNIPQAPFPNGKKKKKGFIVVAVIAAMIMEYFYYICREIK
jgi:hypothetical protein